MPDVADLELLALQASGSTRGVTFSHNQHGPYTRPRTTPSDPNTVFQQAVRTAMAQCVTAWNATLTQAGRGAWERYALAVLLSSPLGRRTHVGGLGMFVRTNVPRLQAAEVTLPRVDVAPALLNLPGFTPITRVVLNVVDDTIHPFFTESDPWTTENGAAMLFWASPGTAPAVNFYKGPYRYAGRLLGSAPSNTSPGTIPLPFPADPGQRVFIRARLTRADGRLSHDFRLPADTTTQAAPIPLTATYEAHPFRPWIHVVFDQLIRRELPFPGNWTARYHDAQLQFVSRTFTDYTMSIRWRVIGLFPGPDVINYTAAPPDTHGLLNGVAVAPFLGFPVA